MSKVTQWSRRLTLCSAAINASAITEITALTALGGMRHLTLQAHFNYAASGTTAKAFVQTSFDSGSTWCDIANFCYSAASGFKVAAIAATSGMAVATPTSGTLANNTVNDGILGDRLRVVLSSAGDHGGKVFKIIGVMRS